MVLQLLCDVSLLPPLGQGNKDAEHLVEMQFGGHEPLKICDLGALQTSSSSVGNPAGELCRRRTLVWRDEQVSKAGGISRIGKPYVPEDW